MQNDIDSFNYTWLLDVVTRLSWGEDVTNLLLVGMPDVVTPAHFDVLENLYVQVSLVFHLKELRQNKQLHISLLFVRDFMGAYNIHDINAAGIELLSQSKHLNVRLYLSFQDSRRIICHKNVVLELKPSLFLDPSYYI